MKKKLSIKTFVCAVAISAVFLSCGTPDDEQNAMSSSSNIQSSSSFENPSSSSLEGMPVWNSRVISYRFTGDYQAGIGLITDKNTLKSWFPDILDNEQAGECNYFAVYYTTSSVALDYMIISQDMVIYSIFPRLYELAEADKPPYPDRQNCDVSADFANHAALICDDEAWTLKNNIDVNLQPIRFIDQDWNCNEEWVGVNKGVFF
jgi:hypothetical protein